MDLISIIFHVISIAIILLFLFNNYNLKRTIKKSYTKIERLSQEKIFIDSKHRQATIKFGQLFEKMIPILNIEGLSINDEFHFMGAPIDYFAITDDKIFFIEVKTGRSQLTVKQKKIKRLVQNKKIEWKEIRLDESIHPPAPT